MTSKTQEANPFEAQFMKKVEKLIDSKLEPMWDEMQFRDAVNDAHNMEVVDVIIDMRDSLAHHFPNYHLESNALHSLHEKYDPVSVSQHQGKPPCHLKIVYSKKEGDDNE